jgi:hypothetical protein
MTCESTHDWLLQADKPDNFDAAPAEIAAHVRGCADCQQLIRRINQTEMVWRTIPDSPRAATSKEAFLKRLVQPPMPATPAVRPGSWRQKLTWIGIAALFIVAGAGVLFFWPPQQPVQAQSDVIEQLVDWNLELTEAATPADRERIFAEKHEKLKFRMKQATLSDIDRELAENLLANGIWLVKNDDPVEELNRFHRVADRLLEKMQHAADKADAMQSERMARQYAKIAERGIDGNLERIKVAKVVDPERKLKIKQMLKEDQDRNVKLLILVEKGSALSQKELRKALDLSEKRHKLKKQEKS